MQAFESYRFHDPRPMPIRALSPCHSGRLGPEYYDLVIERCLRYGYNHIHVCNNLGYGDLDQFIRYRAFPGLEAALKADRGHVDECVRVFRAFTRKARQAGLETYIWHHEINFPRALAEVKPGGFHLDRIHDFPGDAKLPVPDLDSPVIWDFMTARFEEAYEALPDLTGVIMTMQESDIPIYHLSQDPAERVRITRRMYEHISAIHRRLHRKWILRTFAWREWEYETVFAALEGFDPDVVIESKSVPMDWHMHYPFDRFFSLPGSRSKIVEIDAGGNFWGECEVPAACAAHYASEVKFAAEHGCQGITIRTDRAGGHTFDKPMEVNIAVMAEASRNPAADTSRAEMEWLGLTYGAGHAPVVKQILDLGWDVVTRMHFVDRSYFFNHRYWNSLRGTCNLFVAERDLLFEAGDTSFRKEIDLAELYVQRAEGLARDLLKEAGQPIPADLPETLHHHVNPAPDPLAELYRQVRNLRIRHDFFSALKEWVYSVKCQVYERTDAARRRSRSLAGNVAVLARRHPYLLAEQPGAEADMLYICDHIAEREILDARHFSSGQAFHGRSYVMPCPEPIRASLAVRPGGGNILVIFMGTHMCRPVVADVTVNGRRFELSRGTMSWFWAYDGYKRGEVELPADLCGASTIEVTVQGRDPHSTPFVPEVRTEFEYEGYKPRKD